MSKEFDDILRASYFGGSIPDPTEGLRTQPVDIKQARSYRAARTEVRSGTQDILVAGQRKSLEEAIEDEEPGTFATLTQPIFDLLQIGQFAGAGAALELQRSGLAKEAFRKAASEILNALPGLDEDFAERMAGVRPTRPSFSQVLKESGAPIFSETGVGRYSAVAAGLALDVVLDPTTYFGGIVAKPVLKGGLRATSKLLELAHLRGSLGRKFVTDFEMKEAVKTGRISEEGLQAFQVARDRMKSGLAEGQIHVQDAVTKLAKGQTIAERRLMGLYLSQPQKFGAVARQISGNNPNTVLKLTGRMKEFAKYYDDMMIEENKAGLWSYIDLSGDYAPGRYPTTRSSAANMGQLAEKLGIAQKATRPQPFEVPNFPRLAGQGTPGFQKGKIYKTTEERILASVPTELDIALMTAKRGFESSRSIATKKFVDAIVGNPEIATRVAMTQDEMVRLGMMGVNFKPVGDFKAMLDAKEMGLYRPKFGIPDSPTFVMPKEFIKELDYTDSLFKGTSEAEKFFQGFDRVQGVWKGFAVLSPGFHMRNMFSNWFNNSLAGVRNPHAYLDAIRLQARRGDKLSVDVKGIGKKTGEEIVELAKQYGLLGKGHAGADVPREVERQLFSTLEFFRKSGTEAAQKITDPLAKAVAETSGVDLRAQAAGLFRATFGSLLKGNYWLGTTIENNARLAHFLTLLRKGKTADEAAMSVKRYLFDYSNLTTFERDVMKRVLPFYSWARFNIPLQFQTLLEKPGLYAAMTGKPIQAIESMSEDWKDLPTPDYFQEILAIRLPKGAAEGLNTLKRTANDLIGRENDERTKSVQPVYLNPDLPFQGLNQANWKDALSGMTPILKVPIEQLTGPQGNKGFSFFLDRPIESYPGEPSEVTIPGTGIKPRRNVEDVLRAFLPTYGKAQRMRERAGRGQLAEQVSTELLGIKLIATDVDRINRSKTFKRRQTIRNLKRKLQEEGLLQ